jgi:CDGSH-type Zn-finger protein
MYKQILRVSHVFTSSTIKQRYTDIPKPISDTTQIQMTEPVCPQKFPYGIVLEANKQYSFCTCGLSKIQPICDGSHKGKGFKPHRFTVTEAKEYWLCGCKKTKTPPFCDGTHMELI